jgi:hypothetical protein
MKSVTVWDVVAHNLVHVYRRFGGMYLLYLETSAWCLLDACFVYSSTLKMEAVLRETSTRLHGVTSQKIVLFTVSCVLLLLRALSWLFPLSLIPLVHLSPLIFFLYSFSSSVSLSSPYLLLLLPFLSSCYYFILRKYFDQHNWVLTLNPSGYYMYHPLEHTKILHSAHTVYLCVPYGSHNKQRLFPQTALTGWAL